MAASLPESADFAPPVHACPACGAECKRHSAYTRRVKDISLDGPVTLEIRAGKYRCLACRKMFMSELPFAGKGKRYSTRAVRKATAAIQQDKTTYTALPNRLERDFTIRPSKSTGWGWFQDFAGGIDIGEYLRWACSRFSGQLSVDSVSDGEMEMWFATDPLNRDLILGYHRAESADAESLTAFLTVLRDEYGIRPKLFTSDDATVFDNTPRKVWPDVPLQLCHFHVLKWMNYRHVRHSLRARLLKLKPVKPTKPARGCMTAEYIRANRDYRDRQEEWIEMHRKRRLFFKTERKLRTPESVERQEAVSLERWCSRHPELAEIRRFILDVYALINCKDEASAELLRRSFVQRWKQPGEGDEHMGHVVKMFSDAKWYTRLFPFTAFENAHRTTNSTERANRWFRKRQKTHYRNRKEHTIRNMLHADLIYRRERTPTNEPPARLREKPVGRRNTA